MKILISFCNQQNNLVHDNLVLLDSESGETKSFFNFLYNRSITGIAQDKDRIYLCYQDEVNGIIVLKKSDLSVELIRSFPEIKDGHSLAVDNNDLYIASTGNDRVLKFKIIRELNKIEFVGDVYKSEDSELNLDINHINSILLNKNMLYLTALGKKAGEKWTSALDGYILNTSNNDKVVSGLAHPHSLNILDGDYWYIESFTRKVKRNNDTILELPSGYLRGLAVNNNYFVIGTSTGRTISKSMQTMNKDLPSELMQKECKVIIYSYSKSGEVKKINEFDFIDKYQEIYDIKFLT